MVSRTTSGRLSRRPGALRSLDTIGAVRRARRLTVLAVLLVGGCRPAPPGWCAAEDPGAEVVRNSTPGRWPSEPTLVEAWRAGGAEGPQSLAGPGTPAAREDGWLAIPDMMVSEVVVVDGEGNWTGPVLTRGKGPGEVQWPVSVAWTTEGDLLTLDLGSARITEFDVGRGELVDEWRLPGELFSRIAAHGQVPGMWLGENGSLFLQMPPRTVSGLGPHERVVDVLRIGRSGATDTVLSTRVEVIGETPFTDMPKPGAHRPLLSTGPGGSVAVAGEEPVYRIRILTSALRDSLVVCLDDGAAPLSRSERGDTALEEEHLQKLADLLATTEPVASPLPFGGLFFGAGGELWVRRERPDPFGPGIAAEGSGYDIFAAGGAYLGRVNAPERVVLFGHAAGLVFGLERGPYDVMSVVAYRLQ